MPLYADSGVGGFFTGAIDYLGPDPTDSDFGARDFPSDPGTPGPWLGYNPAAHSQYWDRSSRSLRALGDLIAGNTDAAVHVK